MIQVSVSPGSLVAGRLAELTVTLSNTGLGTCSDVVFRLKLPPGMALVSGSDRISLDVIQPQAIHSHRVTVRPGQPGDLKVSTANFAYRDEHGVPQRKHDWSAPIRVLEPGPRPGASGPVPARDPVRLTVSLGGSRLTLGEWAVLDVIVRNETGPHLYDVSLEVDSPLRTHGDIAAVPSLPRGQTDRRAVSVHALERGQVLVTVRTAYRYQDERGQVRAAGQEDPFFVEVAERPAPVPPRPPKEDPVTTILYLVAQPRGTDGLRSYEEMREVDRLLRMGRDRERYRLEDGPATRLHDIGQGLVSYRPQVVNFSGHGTEDGQLVVEGDNGFPDYLDPDGLADLLGVHAASVRCVIVNACHSLILAEAIVKRKIEFAIGMRSEIGDYASVQFSVGFYQALFGGMTVPEAFEHGKAMLRAGPWTNSEYEVPVLLRRS